jgi:hypothetical protein
LKQRACPHRPIFEIPIPGLIPGLRVFNPEIPGLRKWSGIAITFAATDAFDEHESNNNVVWKTPCINLPEDNWIAEEHIDGVGWFIVSNPPPIVGLPTSDAWQLLVVLLKSSSVLSACIITIASTLTFKPTPSDFYAPSSE